MAKKLSSEASSALLAARASLGARIRSTSEVLEELQNAGLVKSQGLTRKGTVERQKLLTRSLDEAFGRE